MAYFDILFCMQLVFFVGQSDCNVNTISRSVDEDAHFDCFHSILLETQNCSRLKFTKLSSNDVSSKVILARPETHTFPKVERIWPTKEGLLLTKVRKSDEGEYSCEIWSGWECIVSKKFTLKIKDCQSQVKKVPLESNAILECTVGNQSFNHSWFMLKSGNSVALPERFQVNGSKLSVKSALASDSGWYRCKYWLGDTQQRCVDINLQVQKLLVKFTTQATEVPTHMQNTQILHGDSGEGFSAVHTAAVLAGVVIIAALVGAVLYWKHNNKVPQETREYEDCVIYDVADDFTTSDPVPKTRMSECALRN